MSLAQPFRLASPTFQSQPPVLFVPLVRFPTISHKHATTKYYWLFSDPASVVLHVSHFWNRLPLVTLMVGCSILSSNWPEKRQPRSFQSITVPSILRELDGWAIIAETVVCYLRCTIPTASSSLLLHSALVLRY